MLNQEELIENYLDDDIKCRILKIDSFDRKAMIVLMEELSKV